MRRRFPSLTALKTFEAVARTLSFTSAARELGVTQAAVSRQIKALEEQLTVQLAKYFSAASIRPLARSSSPWPGSRGAVTAIS